MTLFDRGGKRMVLDGCRPALPSPEHDPVARANAAEAAVGALADGRPMRITVASPPATITDVIAPLLANPGPDARASPHRQVTTRLRGAIGNDLSAHLASRLVTPSLRAWLFSQVAADGHVSSWSSTTLPSADC